MGFDKTAYMRDYHVKYRDRNREALNAYKRNWRMARGDRERIETVERMRVWRAANPERAAAANRRGRHVRRSRERGGGKYTAAEWNSIPFNWLCSYCGSDIDITVDHVVPIADGGSNTIDNIVPACRSCNFRKGTQSLLMFLAT